MPKNREFDELLYLRNENRRLRKLLHDHTLPLDVLLKRRGFSVFKKNPSEDLLLPEEEFLDEYYRMLHRYSFRLFLRDVIKHQDFFQAEKVTRYATPEVTADFLGYILSLGLITETGNGYQLARRPVKSFGGTLEWYVAELVKREFCSESLWGVKFKRPRIGGDYDVLGKFNGSLLYIEVKSSPPKQIYAAEISSFLDRVTDLIPQIAVFFVDTELRMKDKIVPLFEEELDKKYTTPPQVTRIEKELFQIAEGIFIINAKDSIISNIERILEKYFRR
jgi:hypothetical protein